MGRRAPSTRSRVPPVAYATRRAAVTRNRGQSADLRVRRTRRLLQRALIELTTEKGFAALTVGEIARRALVNRSTFYRHYTDKQALLDDYAEDVYRLTVPQEGSAPGKPPAGLINLLEHIRAHAGFYRAMLGARGDPAFARRIQQGIERRLRSLLPGRAAKPEPGPPPIDFYLSYVSYAGLGAMIWWLEHGQAFSSEQVAGWLSRLSTVDMRASLS